MRELKPILAIVVPCYNEELCIRTTIEKLLNVINSSFQKLVKLVKSSAPENAKVVRMADKWATLIVAIAFTASILTYLYTFEIIRSVTILVVFCPCALVLATPTAISAAIATLVMAFCANLPVALAPGLGLNAFFTYTVVLGMKCSPAFALTAVLLEGFLFILLFHNASHLKG